LETWTLLQIAFDLVCVVGFIAAWSRLRRPPQDDPRLSRGLQLLQTKITILEDLSNRTDNQAKQLTMLFDQKMRMLQNKVLEAEQQILKIDHSMNKSLEVAEIFQDKIPHHEILERQRTIEYVKAARMAHSGLDVEEISQRVSLPREQVELIAKFNRDQLMFDESQLPPWAKKAVEEGDPDFALNRMDFVDGLEAPAADNIHVEKIEKEFKQAVADAREAEARALAEAAKPMIPSITIPQITIPEPVQPVVNAMKSGAQSLKDRIATAAEELLKTTASASISAPSVSSPGSADSSARPVMSAAAAAGPASQVKKVIFPRIDKI
jgi:hypothetical protein